MSECLLTTDELAEVLAVRPSTVRRWAREGRIPEIRISAKVRRFDYEEVVRALRGHASDRGEER